MAKRIKPVDSNFSTVRMTENGNVATDAEMKSGAETVLEKFEKEKPLAAGDFSDEVKAKLESIEKIESANAALTEEKSELESKIAGYLDEIDGLKKSLVEKTEAEKKAVSELKAKTEEYLGEIKELKESLENKTSASVRTRSEESGELEALRREVKSLRTENDNALMKISDLTFDNAKLREEARELKSKAESAEQNRSCRASQIPKNKQKLNVYRSAVAKMNGYSDWN